MRKPWIRALAGFTVLALPALVCLIGVHLDRLSIGHHPAYEPWIPVGLCSSVLLAAVVPSVLIMTSTPLPQRIGLTATMLCLLALECGLAGYIVLTEGVH